MAALSAESTLDDGLDDKRSPENGAKKLNEYQGLDGKRSPGNGVKKLND